MLHHALCAKSRLRALHSAFLVGLLAAIAGPACALYEEMEPLMPEPVFIGVEPATLELGVGETMTLSATVYGEDDEILGGHEVAWSNLDEDVATVSRDGAVRGISPGLARIRAEFGGVVGTAKVHVFYRVESVEIQAEDTMFFPGEHAQMTAHAYNINGEILGDIDVEWTVEDASIARVTADGFVMAEALGRTELTAQVDGVSHTVPIDVVQWQQISAGHHYSCGVLSNGAAYCWGQNSSDGVLGNGSVDSGQGWPDINHDADADTPTKVSSDIVFASVTAGLFHTCGLTPEGQAYCWGYGLNGQLGNGSIASSATPVAVRGAYRFSDIQLGDFHTCGLSTSQNIYCWGGNGGNQLGLGAAATTFYFEPQQVPERQFVALAVGRNHSCAISDQGPTYCWGNNEFGQLGDDTRLEREEPVEVDTTQDFVKLAAGANFSCGLNDEGRAYCWGEGRAGALGRGTTYDRDYPLAIGGTHTFVDLFAGGASGCGIDASNAVSCWGANEQGNLGNGELNTMESSVTPVTGSYQWRDISLGLQHSCGLVAADSGAYCWGDNDFGQIGNGYFQDYLMVPSAVVNP